MEEGVDAYLAEGWRPAETIAHHYAVAALPDDRTMVIMQYCRVRARTYISTVKGLKLNVPNDLFNDYRRTYVTDVGPRVIRGDAALTVDLGCRWVNVSETIGAVGIYGAETFTLHQAGRRRAAGYGESLFYDELCFPCRIDARDVDPASLVLDCASAVLSAAGSSETGDLAAGGVARLHCAADAVRAVRVAGADGDRYILAAGFSNRELTADIQVDIAASACRDLVSGYRHDLSSGRLRLSLTPGAACLLRLEGV